MLSASLTRDKVVFYRCFATLFLAGVQIVPCLAALSMQVQHPHLRVALARIHRKVLEGHLLSRSLKEEPQVFFAMEVHCLGAGEQGGFLHVALEGLANYFEEQERLRRQVTGDLVYPLAVVALSLLMVALFPPFLQRSLGSLLESPGASLPFLTRCLSSFSLILGSPWTWLVVFTMFWAGAQLWRQAPRTRRELWVARIPVFGSLLDRLYCIWFLRTLRLALEAGLTLLDGLKMAGSATGSSLFANRVGVASQRVELGETLCDSLTRAKVIPAWVGGFLEAGEQSGHLSHLLKRAGQMLEEDWRNRVQTFLTLLQPLVLGFLGLIVAVLALGALMPLGKILESL